MTKNKDLLIRKAIAELQEEGIELNNVILILEKETAPKKYKDNIYGIKVKWI